ncbi:FAD:protein FMN transferase [Paracoccus aerodenitrificans]|uniref:FAD:protein FMN transferase n=1 Tax=Paracoccus aerodenitrificans TaxID=3017781 RepID=UPI0022F0E621|nr:FAD:protein FMN transferase [Paracoccus aerodenitrificans]WBU63915.1 FAD:protein FMN transferase [Paracoccus aerodenitrificans]
MANLMTLSRRNFLIMPLALAACKANAAVVETSGTTMGTVYNVTAIDPDGKVSQQALRSAIDASLAEVNAQMSNWDAGSEISRFNAQPAGTMPVSEGLGRVMSAAQDVHLASEGQFDVAIGPLIDCWGFGAGVARHNAPSDAEIAAALEVSGQERTLSLQPGGLTKSTDRAGVYLSGIGKGYGVDRVAAAVESLGLTDYMIEIGGDLYTSGRNAQGMSWRIGIETPDAVGRSVLKVVSASNMGMATSGDYRNYFEQDGVRYSHLIDPQNGRPITHRTASASVMAENAMLADAWATAMLILGRERGLEIAQRNNLAVLFVERNSSGSKPFTITQSPRFSELQA